MKISVVRSEESENHEIVDKRRPQAGLYYVIPSFVMECEQLEHSEIVFYALVSGLAINKGYCFASDEYLAERMRVEDRTIRKWLLKLEELGFLKRETLKKGMYWDRKIYIVFPNSNNCYERTYKSGSNGPTVPIDKDLQGRIVGKEELVSKDEPNRTDKEPDRIGSNGSPFSSKKEEKKVPSIEEIEMVCDHAAQRSEKKIRLKHSDIRMWVMKYGLEMTIRAVDLAVEDLRSGSLLTNPAGWITNALKNGY